MALTEKSQRNKNDFIATAKDIIQRRICLGCEYTYTDDQGTRHTDFALTRRDIKKVLADSPGLSWPNWLSTKDNECHMKSTEGHKAYICNEIRIADWAPILSPKDPKPAKAPKLDLTKEVELKHQQIGRLESQGSFVPVVNPVWIKFGFAKHLEKIIQSRLFFPAFITGPTGVGKTFDVEQVCAALGRECFRVPITELTDEEDLVGGFRLINGDTVFSYGPVVEAMKRGAVLLLDEIDLASPKILCLQSALEGNPLYIKSINETIIPADGFTVVATANTKGKGDETGNYMGANILNEAFLDRFQVTFEAEAPNITMETNIVLKAMEHFAGTKDLQFADNLATWASKIRRACFEGSIEEMISTRRLVGIIKTWALFQNKAKAIQMSLSRFDQPTQKSFIAFYKAVDNSDGVVMEEDES